MSIDVERGSHFNLWKCPRDRIDYRGCTIRVMGRHSNSCYCR